MALIGGCGQQKDIAKFFPEIPLESRGISASGGTPQHIKTIQEEYEYFSVDYYDGMSHSFDSLINSFARLKWRLFDVMYIGNKQTFKIIFERQKK